MRGALPKEHSSRQPSFSATGAELLWWTNERLGEAERQSACLLSSRVKPLWIEADAYATIKNIKVAAEIWRGDLHGTEKFQVRMER